MKRITVTLYRRASSSFGQEYCIKKLVNAVAIGDKRVVGNYISEAEVQKVCDAPNTDVVITLGK